MSEELFMRDDIIELGNKLDSECFNVKAYRKQKTKSKSRKTSVLGQLTTDMGYSQENILKINNSLSKGGFSHQKHEQKRISTTGGMRHRHDLSQNLRNFNKSVNIRQHMASHKRQQSQKEIKTARINYNNGSNGIYENGKKSWEMDGEQTGRVEEEKDQFVMKNKYKQLQQQHHKSGVMSQRAIENWLNQILMEYCHQEQFDKSIDNAALKKMSIDRNSLLSQGINPQYVSRVYKSMFVYSIGFNNLLKQLSGRNSNLKKTIWKVYAILLEFCSEGTFETMIGEIQRDKARKIGSLREEIEKRQRIIENNDQINEEKNGKIFKELKILRQENINLQNQKNVLIEDFKEAEQSFNQQVSMRLKFQNKINEIHGIHHQLSTKHARLYDDYHKKVNELEMLEKSYKQLAENFLLKKEKLARTTEDLQHQKRDNVAMNQLLTKYEQMRTKFQNSQIELKSSKEDLQNIIKQKIRKISQLQVQSQNHDIMLSLSKSSHSQLQQQYQQQLKENKKLYLTIRQQIAQLNDLFTEKKHFNQKHMFYVAEIQFLKNKESQMKITLDKLKKQWKQLSQVNCSLQLDKLTLQKKLQQIQKDLSSCYKNIEEMKKTKNLYQQQLVYLKKKTETHGEAINEKDALLVSLTRSNQKLTHQNQAIISLNKNLDSKATVLAQRLKSQEEINKKKFEKLKDQRDQLFKENSQHDALLQDKMTQLEKYMSLYDKQNLNLKNQRFERVNLDLRYKQSLVVMESENDYIKKLNIVISENHQEIEDWKRKQRNFQYIVKEKEHLFEVERKSIKMYLDEARREVAKKKSFVNPMLLEDLRGLLKRAIEKYQSLLKDHNNKISELKTTQKSLFHQMEQKNKQFQTQLKQQQTNSIKRYQQKQYQLQYQKQKSKHLQQKLQEFQKIIIQNKNALQSPESHKEKERKYLNSIKEKSQHVEKLLKQLENSHDHNNTLVKRISEIENIITEKNEEISEFERNITKMGQQIQLEKQKISQTNRQKETLSSRIEDYEENLLTAMNQEGHFNTKKPLSSGRENSHRAHNPGFEIREPSQHSNRRLTSKQKTEQQKEDVFGNNTIRQKSRQKSEKVVNPVWRSDFGKKLKNAFNYYQK